VVAEFSGQVFAGLVGPFSRGGIGRSKKDSGEGYIAGSGKPDRDRGLGEEGGNASGCVRIGFQFTAMLLILGGPFLEIAELTAGPAELLRHRGNGRGHVLCRLIDVDGQRSGASRDLPQLPGKECLADTCVAVNIEQEPAAFIINKKFEIFLILDQLPSRPTKPLRWRSRMRSCSDRLCMPIPPSIGQTL
jgi:hypothetical protein